MVIILVVGIFEKSPFCRSIDTSRRFDSIQVDQFAFTTLPIVKQEEDLVSHEFNFSQFNWIYQVNLIIFGRLCTWWELENGAPSIRQQLKTDFWLLPSL